MGSGFGWVHQKCIILGFFQKHICCNDRADIFCNCIDFDLMKVISSLYSYFRPQEAVQVNEDLKVHTKLPNGAIFTGNFRN